LIPLVLILFGLSILLVAYLARFLVTRIDNCLARVERLEAHNDRVAGFDKAMDKDVKVTLRCHPDRKCTKCHGRGFIGKNSVTGLYIPCACCA
jgi:hypothetical protein